jgi:hypothetical protein
MKHTNERFQWKNAFIVVAILALPVTKAQSAEVGIGMQNTVPGDSGSKNASSDEGSISEFLDLAVPLGSSPSGISRTSASADLASGSLHAYALAHSSSAATAYAQAYFSDVLTFTADPGTTWAGSDWVYATITMSVHAVKSDFTGVPGAPNGNFAELGYWGGGTGGSDGDSISFLAVDGLTSINRTLVLSDIAVFHPLRPEGERIHLSGAVRAWVKASSFYQDKVDGEYYGQFDASHTAVISIDVPEGIGFTSESGLFLTNPIQEPVPLKITAFVAQGGGSWQVTFKGENSTNYKLTGATDTDFTFSTDISYTTVVTGSVVDVTTFATDASGDAVVSIPLTGPKNFIRVETP